MSRGYGKVQRAIIKVLTEETEVIQGSAHELAKFVYDLQGRPPEEKHMNAVNRALKGLWRWLDENGWSLERDTLKKLGMNRTTNNGRAATGLANKVRHKGRWGALIKAAGDKRRAEEHATIDAMGDNERVAFLHDQAAQEALGTARPSVNMMVLAELLDILDKYPVGLDDVPMLKRAVIDAHLKHRQRIEDNAQEKVDASKERIASRA